MLNNIFLKFSEFARLGKEEHPFSNKYGATAEAILTEYKTNYDKKFAEVTTHQHKRALALTSRKFLHMLFGLLDKSQLYSAEKSR